MKHKIMLTDEKMLEIAERYLSKMVDNKIETVIILEETIKKPYGNIYLYNSKQFILTEDFKYAVGGNAPFLVEKETGRVVTFGTAGRLEDYIMAYENGTLSTALDNYWYPDEDRYDYK